MARQTLFFVDASVYFFRAWFSMPDAIRDEQGNSINGVYGYLLFLASFLQQVGAGKIAFAFDESLGTCFRNRIYPAYKSSRVLPDDNLSLQLRLSRKLTEAAGLACYSSKRFEADDLIGSLAQQFRRGRQRNCVILSRDKDLGQLLRGEDRLWDFAANQWLDRQGFMGKFGILPERLPDYLGLVGDKVDDIPGVSGIGAKAAQKLLTEYSNLEGLYKHLPKVGSLDIRGAARIQGKLQEGRELAFISRELATIRCDLEPAASISDLHWQGLDTRRFERALSRYGIQGKSRKAISSAFSQVLLS